MYLSASGALFAWQLEQMSRAPAPEFVSPMKAGGVEGTRTSRDEGIFSGRSVTNFDGIAHQAVDRHAGRPRCDQQVLHRNLYRIPHGISASLRMRRKVAEKPGP